MQRGTDIRRGGVVGADARPARREGSSTCANTFEILNIGQCRGRQAHRGERGGHRPRALVAATAVGLHIHIVSGAGQQIADRVGECCCGFGCAGGNGGAGGHYHHIPVGLAIARDPGDCYRIAGNMRQSYINGWQTGGNGSQFHIIDIHITGTFIRSTDGNIAAVACEVIEQHLLIVPSAGLRHIRAVETLHHREGVRIGRIAHHTHVKTSVSGGGRGFQGLQVHHQRVDRQNRGVYFGKNSITVVGCSAVEIEGGIAGGVVAGAEIRICGVIVGAGPAVG